MATKIYVSGSFIIAEDVATRVNFFKKKSSDVYHIRDDDDQFSFFQSGMFPHVPGQEQHLQLGIQSTITWDTQELEPAQKTGFQFDDIVDVNGVIYPDADTLDDYLNDNLGRLEVNVAGGSGGVDSVNGQTGVVVLDADDISDTGTNNKFSSNFNIDLDSAEASVVRVFAGGRTTYTVTHGLNSLDVTAQTFRLSNGRTIGLRVERTGVNTIDVSRSGNSADGIYRVLIGKIG